MPSHGSTGKRLSLTGCASRRPVARACEGQQLRNSHRPRNRQRGAAALVHAALRQVIVELRAAQTGPSVGLASCAANANVHRRRRWPFPTLLWSETSTAISPQSRSAALAVTRSMAISQLLAFHTRARPDGERHIPSTRGACQSSRVTAFQPSNDAFSGPELVCSCDGPPSL